MIPYWAILKDSFREAFASRVLWVLLLVSGLLLAVIAGFGMEEHAGASFTGDDILDPARFYQQLVTSANAPHASPGKRIWTLADEATKQDLADVAQSMQSNAFGNPLATLLSGLMNRLLNRPDLYDAAAWSAVRLDSEARKLLAADPKRLPNEEVARLNRLLIEAAYPTEIAPSRDEELYVSYWGSLLGTPIPLRREFVIKTAVYYFAKLVVGMLGIFCGIIVTASIIPQTFEPGSVDLLLSKPISRSLLYLTKFIGGCAFTLITAAFILGGLWLVVGWRHEIWIPALLWCIPVFLFVFAIYYSVSAFVGLIWKNTIVSVVLTVFFWAICWSLGAIKTLVIETFFIEPVRPIKMVAAGDDLIAANAQGLIIRWDDASRRWVEILVPDEGPRWRPFGGGLPLAGPLYDPRAERVIVAQKPSRRFALLSSTALAVGSREEQWRRREAISVPQQTALLAHDPQGRLLAVAPTGIFRQVGELVANQSGQPRTSVEVFGMQVPLPFSAAPVNAMIDVGPPMRLTIPFSAAVDAKTGAIAIYNREVLSVFAIQENGRYQERARKELTDTGSGIAAFAGDRILLGLEDGRIQIYEADDLLLLNAHAPRPSIAPRFIEAASDGKTFAVLLHNRTLWLYDVATDRMILAQVAGQDDISSVNFDGDDGLLVADRTSRVTRYRLSDMSIDWQVEADADWLETLYRYLVKPLHAAFPKPTEVDAIVQYMLTDRRMAVAGPRDGDLRTRQVKLDLWGPLWSNLAFLGVMLLAGCIYTQRKDF